MDMVRKTTHRHSWGVPPSHRDRSLPSGGAVMFELLMLNARVRTCVSPCR
jgi:hypothetical protein